MKTQLQTSYIKLTAILAVAAPLALALGGSRSRSPTAPATREGGA